MKKIAFVIHNMEEGGAQKVLVNLVNNMDYSRYDITVISIFDGINSKFLSKKIKYKYFFSKTFRGNKIIMKCFPPKLLAKFFLNEEYQVLISYLEGITARIVSGYNKDNTKLVSWIHVQQYTKRSASQSFRNYNEAVKCYSKYDKTICVSNYVKDDFTNVFPMITNVEVIYNTNESELIKKLSASHIDIQLDSVYSNICAIGSLKKSKGFDRLIRIVDKLIKDKLMIRLYILGIGPLEKNLKDLVKKYNLENNVFFLGYQTNPYKYLSKMDMFVCSSYAEGFSTAATEALILGIPIVTVNVSGMKEMLGENNEFGIVTKNDDNCLYFAIKDMILDNRKKSCYAMKAKERGEYFNTKCTVDSVDKMLKEL